MEQIIDGKKPLSKEEKALNISLGYHNRDFDTVIVAVESSSIFHEDSESLRDWATKNKQTLITVKKDGKVLIGETAEVEEPEVKPKKGKK